MGWKASLIVIHKPNRVGNQQLLEELGFNNLSKIEDKTFEEIINPDDNRVYIGEYNNNLIICAPELPMQFFEDNESYVEHKFTQIFPNSEICAIVLHSTVNLWGFSVTINGKKVRAKAGSSDDGTFVDYGEPLPEELELLNGAIVDENGIRTYTDTILPDEIFTEDQVGENFVFSIWTRYFDVELDGMEESLFETEFAGYSYGNVIMKNAEIKVGNKPWWKFW